MAGGRRALRATRAGRSRGADAGAPGRLAGHPRRRAWSAPPLAIEVASAVGAGDSFVGGMVWALQGGLPLQEAFAWGVASGSAALMSVSTGLSRREDAQQLFPERTANGDAPHANA